MNSLLKGLKSRRQASREKLNRTRGNERLSRSHEALDTIADRRCHESTESINTESLQTPLGRNVAETYALCLYVIENPTLENLERARKYLSTVLNYPLEILSEISMVSLLRVEREIEILLTQCYKHENTVCRDFGVDRSADDAAYEHSRPLLVPPAVDKVGADHTFPPTKPIDPCHENLNAWQTFPLAKPLENSDNHAADAESHRPAGATGATDNHPDIPGPSNPSASDRPSARTLAYGDATDKGKPESQAPNQGAPARTDFPNATDQGSNPHHGGNPFFNPMGNVAAIGQGPALHHGSNPMAKVAAIDQGSALHHGGNPFFNPMGNVAAIDQGPALHHGSNPMAKVAATDRGSALHHGRNIAGNMTIDSRPLAPYHDRNTGLPITNPLVNLNDATTCDPRNPWNSLPMQPTAPSHSWGGTHYLAAYNNPYIAQSTCPGYGTGPFYGPGNASLPHPYSGYYQTQIPPINIQGKSQIKTEENTGETNIKLQTDTTEQQNACRLSQYREVSLQHAINLLPTYDGKPNLLAVFCKSIRDILKEFGPGAERWIMMALPTKLKGRAAEGYNARLTQYTTIEAFLSDLTMQFRGFSSADTVLMEIKTARQQPNENAGDFGLRMQNLHNQVLNVYDMTEPLDDTTKTVFKNNADTEVLDQYILGLKGNLQHQVRSENPKTLREAIYSAVRFEQKDSARKLYAPETNGSEKCIIAKLNSAYDSHEAEMNAETNEETAGQTADVRRAATRDTCSHCKSAAHSEGECRKKDFDVRFCDYCNIRGHTLGECRSLIDDIRAGKVRKFRDNDRDRARFNNRPAQRYPQNDNRGRFSDYRNNNQFRDNNRGFNENRYNNRNRDRDRGNYGRNNYGRDNYGRDNYNRDNYGSVHNGVYYSRDNRNNVYNNNERNNYNSKERDSLNSQDARRTAPTSSDHCPKLNQVNAQ